MFLGQRAVALGGVEAFGVPLLEVGGLQDRHVHPSVLEHVLDEVLLGVLHELLERPVGLGRAEAHVGVEALDPALGVLLLPLDPVLRARVPEVEMGVKDEVLLAVLLVHAGASYSTGWRSKSMYSAASSGLANSNTRSSRT